MGGDGKAEKKQDKDGQTKYMTEINVTSPTGVREVKKFGGADISALFWDAVEAKR